MDVNDIHSLRSAALDVVRRNSNCVKALAEAQRVLIDSDWLADIQNSPENIVQNFISDVCCSPKTLCTEDVVSFFKKLEVERKISRNHFIFHAANSLNSFDMNVLLRFMEEDIFPISELLANDATSAFFLKKILSHSLKHAGHSLIQGVTELLLQRGFTSEYPSDTAMRAKKFLMQLIMDFYTCEKWTPNLYSALDSIQESRTISSEMIGAVHEYLISELLTLPPTVSAMEVVPCQHELTFHCFPPKFAALFSLLGDCLENAKVFAAIQAALLSQNGPNWRWVLMFVASKAHLQPSFQDDFYTFLSDMATSALLKPSLEMLTNSIVLARHTNSSSTTYKTWFKQSFGQSKQNPVAGKKHLQVLIESLTALVPYEPAAYLKIHLDAVMTWADRSFDVVTDYVTLVRTRLLDVKDSRVDDGYTASLVQEAVQEFGNTGHILPAVTEASVFRSPFYVNCFLPLLLCPLAKENDTQVAFIRALFKQGKIPQNMYHEYIAVKSECTEQADFSTHRDGLVVVFKVIENIAHQNMEFSYEQSLDAFRTVGTRFKNEQRNYSVESPALVPMEIEVVDNIINTVCLKISDTGQSTQWVSTIIRLCAETESFLWPLFVRLWELLTKQMKDLSRVHLRGLACIVAHLTYSETPPSKSFNLTAPPEALRTFQQWVLLILENLPLSNQQNMRSCFQFSLNYQYFSRGFDHRAAFSGVDSLIMAKCVYLHLRFYGSEDMSGFDKLDILQSSFKVPELSYSQWLKWEFCIDPHNDFLAHYERLLYLEKTFHQFLKTEPGNTTSDAMNKLFSTLLIPGLPSYNFGVLLLKEVLAPMESKSCESPLVGAVEYVLVHTLHAYRAQLSVSIVQENVPLTATLYKGIVKALCDLPAEYLLTHGRHQALELLHLQLSANCLLSIQTLSNHRHPDSLLFPPSLTLHITKVLAKSSAIERFCSCSLLYHSSLLFALTKCPPAVSGIHSIPADILADVEWLSNLPLETPVPSLPAAVALFSMAFHSSQQNLLSFECLITSSESVQVAFFDCCIRVLAGHILDSGADDLITALFRLAKDWILLEPSFMCCVQSDLQFCQHRDFLDEFREDFPLAGLNSIPYVFFRLLCDFPSSTVTEWCTSGWPLAKCCLASHCQLMELQYASHLQSYMAFEVDFLQSCAQMTKLVIKNTSYNLEDTRHHWTLHYLTKQHS